MSDEPEVTTEVQDARETRDLVLTLLLKLAARTVAFVDSSEDRVRTAWLDEEHPAGGFTWQLAAGYSRGSAFVRVEAEPQTDGSGRTMFTVQAFAQAVGNEQAAVKTHVPRAWVEMAARAAEERPE